VFAWTPVAIAGLGLVGLGLSVPFPLALRAAGLLSQGETESALAAVTIWGNAGLLVGPTALGFLASRAGLRLAFALIVFLCLLAALCASGVRVRRSPNLSGKR
jgi:MFS family permease